MKFRKGDRVRFRQDLSLAEAISKMTPFPGWMPEMERLHEEGTPGIVRSGPSTGNNYRIAFYGVVSSFNYAADVLELVPEEETMPELKMGDTVRLRRDLPLDAVREIITNTTGWVEDMAYYHASMEYGTVYAIWNEDGEHIIYDVDIGGEIYGYPREALEIVVTDEAMKAQIGGTHYTSMTIQPVEYIMANGIPFVEGSVIKYVSRWRNKGGVEDLKKARHFLDILIEREENN